MFEDYFQELLLHAVSCIYYALNAYVCMEALARVVRRYINIIMNNIDGIVEILFHPFIHCSMLIIIEWLARNEKQNIRLCRL